MSLESIRSTLRSILRGGENDTPPKSKLEPAYRGDELVKIDDITIRLDQLQKIAPSPCNVEQSCRPAQGNWSFAELWKLIEGYDPKISGNIGKSNHCDPNKFDGTEVKCWARFTSMGGVESRKFADWLDDKCTDILDIASDQKCEDLINAVEIFAEEPFWLKVLFWSGEKFAGAVEIFLIFGPAIYAYHTWRGKNDRNKPGGGGDPAGGGGKLRIVPQDHNGDDSLVHKMSIVALAASALAGLAITVVRASPKWNPVGAAASLVVAGITLFTGMPMAYSDTRSELRRYSSGKEYENHIKREILSDLLCNAIGCSTAE